jgi:hypothetical protein
MTPVFGGSRRRRQAAKTSTSLHFTFTCLLSNCTYYILERPVDLKRSIVCITLSSPIVPALPKTKSHHVSLITDGHWRRMVSLSAVLLSLSYLIVLLPSFLTVFHCLEECWAGVPVPSPSPSPEEFQCVVILSWVDTGFSFCCSSVLLLSVALSLSVAVFVGVCCR